MYSDVNLSVSMRSVSFGKEFINGNAVYVGNGFLQFRGLPTAINDMGYVLPRRINRLGHVRLRNAG